VIHVRIVLAVLCVLTIATSPPSARGCCGEYKRLNQSDSRHGSLSFFTQHQDAIVLKEGLCAVPSNST